MLTTFVSIALLSSLCAAILGALVQKRQRAQQLPSHSLQRHEQEEHAATSLLDRPRILSVETFHSGARGRYVLACIAPEALIVQEDTLWATRICLDLLERTGAHVIVLEVYDTARQLRFRRLVTSDRLGWTGDRFDRVGLASWWPGKPA